MLTKRSHIRIHIVPALALALAFPAAALAVGSDGEDSAGPALANAKRVTIAPLRGPVVSFHQAIHASVQQRRAEHRAKLREQRERFESLPGGVSLSTLESIASCESGGDPTIVSADGSYRGKYQFDYGTWESVGGSGDPAAAPEHEQDYRAALLYAQSGSSPWPVCG